MNSNGSIMFVISPGIPKAYSQFSQGRWMITKQLNSNLKTVNCRSSICPSAKLKTPISRRVILSTVAATAFNLLIQFPSKSEEKQVSEESNSTDITIGDIDPAINEPEITDRVFLDISVSGKPSNRIIIGLYGTVTPMTVNNFKKLATNGYSGTDVYRIIPGLTIQLGDVLDNGGKSGRAATEDGQSLPSENFRVKHTIPGIVSMVRDPQGRIDSRFFIATRPGDSGYLDGKYVGFGRVVEGMDVIYRLEKEGGNRIVKRNVKIVNSGLLE